MFSSGKSRLAPSTASALSGKRENSLGGLDQFLKEEVEADLVTLMGQLTLLELNLVVVVEMQELV